MKASFLLLFLQSVSKRLLPVLVFSLLTSLLRRGRSIWEGRGRCPRDSALPPVTDRHVLSWPPLVAENARMMPPWLLARTLIMALFFSCLTPGSLNPCIEVVPNITYQCMDQKLSKVPDDIPSSTKNIDLSFNPLKILKSYSFSNFSELQWLDLSRCEIETIEDKAWHGLHHLSNLILTGNPIQSFSPGSFSGLTSLENLVAVETKLASLESFPIGQLITLKKLNVAHNFIHSCK